MTSSLKGAGRDCDMMREGGEGVEEEGEVNVIKSGEIVLF